MRYAEPPDNSKLREAIADFVRSDELLRDDLRRRVISEGTFVLVPMLLDPDEDAFPSFTTVVGDTGKVLHVYTTPSELLELDADNTIMLLNLGELIMDLLKKDYNGSIIDPDAPHAVCIHFWNGRYSFYSSAKLDELLANPPST